MKKNILMISVFLMANMVLGQTNDNINISIGRNAVGVSGPWWLNNIVNPSGNNNSSNKSDNKDVKKEENKTVNSISNEQLDSIQKKLDQIVESTKNTEAAPKSANTLVSNPKQTIENNKSRTGQIFDENLSDLESKDVTLWNKSTLNQLNNKVKMK